MKGHEPTSRRDFLRIGASSLAGGAFLSSAACTSEPSERSAGERKIVCRTLGKTGLELPVVSMGSCYAIDLVRTALDEGIVYIHTSSGYGESNHERILGEVFRGRPRDSFVVATSPDLPYRYDRGRGRSLGLGKGVDPRLISESIEGSLQRLGLDYVDIYYLCSISSVEVVQFGPYVDAFEKLKGDGKVRFVGIGTHENEPEVIRAAVDGGFWDVVLTSYNFRQSHREEIGDAIRQAAEAGLGVVAMKTQAGVYWDRTRLLKINMKAALKWVLKNESVHTTIPAFSNYEEMDEDLSVMEDVTPTRDEIEDLDLGARLDLPGLYCQQCRVCVDQCQTGLEIPTLMRGYMYAFGYREPGKARETLRSWTPAMIACRNCEICTVECSLGFDVRSRALDIARILEVPEEFLG